MCVCVWVSFFHIHVILTYLLSLLLQCCFIQIPLSFFCMGTKLKLHIIYVVPTGYKSTEKLLENVTISPFILVKISRSHAHIDFMLMKLTDGSELIYPIFFKTDGGSVHPYRIEQYASFINLFPTLITLIFNFSSLFRQSNRLQMPHVNILFYNSFSTFSITSGQSIFTIKG